LHQYIRASGDHDTARAGSAEISKFDGIDSLETILGKLGNPSCEELDIGVAESSLTSFQESRGSVAMFSKG
jgi:hypothetical protein